MPVEIRELNIKVTVDSNNINTGFNQINSPLFDTQFVSQLKREIIEECKEIILDKLERSKSR